jgi:excisionase family DNA binding protein
VNDPGGAPDGSAAGLITLEEAARRLDLHYMTLYRYVRTGRLQARRHGRRWLVDPDEVTALGGGPRRPRDRSWDQRSERLVRRLLAGDARGCWYIVDDALLAGSPSDAYLSLLAPALRTVGDLWAAGDISVGDEHRATAVAVGLVGRLGPLFAHRGAPRAGTVLLGGVAGDPHLLPGRMVADVVRGEGFAVVDLGANVPPEALVEAGTGLTDLRAVGISLSDSNLAPVAARTVTALHQALPGVAVVAGGTALESMAAAQALGADYWAPDARLAARVIGDLPTGPGGSQRSIPGRGGDE